MRGAITLVRTSLRAGLLPFIPRPGPAPFLPDRLERGGGAGRQFYARPLWRWHSQLLPGHAAGLPDMEVADASSAAGESSDSKAASRKKDLQPQANLLDGVRTGALGPHSGGPLLPRPVVVGDVMRP